MQHAEPLVHYSARPPSLNGRYVVTRLLGKGAQARVYLTYDTNQKAWRAAKVLAVDYLDDAEVRARFEREARAMARMSHRNVLRVHDVGVDGVTPYIIMELARGGGVTDWLKRNGYMPPRVACQLIIDACAGIGHAHGEGVVHRDIKPHNLLLGEDGRTLVTDFGIAQVAEALSMTQTGSVMGTFAYMSPEQRSDAKAVDERADVYSLGATLYTLLSLKTSAELFFAEARDEILAPIPELLRTPILDACRYDRDDRMASVQVLSNALRALLPQLPVVPSAPLTDAVLDLPRVPPEWVDPSAGVEDLREALERGTQAAVPPPVPNRQDLARMLEGQSTTLYSDTGYEDAPTVMPYRLPERNIGASRARASLGELSVEDIPEYIDLSTVERVRRHVDEIIENAEAKARREREVATSPDAKIGVAWFYAAAAVVAAATLLIVVVGFGVALKVSASMALDTAELDLLDEVHEQRGLITELTAKGGDRKALEQAFFQVQDAPRAEAPMVAAHFVALAEAEAARVRAEGMGMSQVAMIGGARDRWVDAREDLADVRTSRLGSITGGLGVLR